MNKEWTDEIEKLFAKEITTAKVKVQCGDVQTIPTENAIFVSPANSLGFMDGGIDYVYSRKMFPGCETKVKDKIRVLNHTTFLGRPYLPIGSAFSVKVAEKTHLICAPTMFLPQIVSETRNAYLSYLATLILFKKMFANANTIETLVLTSHCCGYGKMTPEECAKQMRQAYDDFLQVKYPIDKSTDTSVVLMPNYDNEQPDNYDNREIKDIPIEKIFVKKR